MTQQDEPRPRFKKHDLVRVVPSCFEGRIGIVVDMRLRPTGEPEYLVHLGLEWYDAFAEDDLALADTSAIKEIRPMPKWEYCIFTCETVSRIDATDEHELAARDFTIIKDADDPRHDVALLGHVLFLRTGEKQTVTSFQEAVTQLGLAGWDLVSHTVLVSGTRHYVQHDVLTFKREVSA